MENCTIDHEWEKFLSNYNNSDNNSDIIDYDDIDEDNNIENIYQINDNLTLSADILDKIEHPKSCDIYISTKTKIAYLNQPIDIYNIFWEIPIIPYSLPDLTQTNIWNLNLYKIN